MATELTIEDTIEERVRWNLIIEAVVQTDRISSFGNSPY